MTPPAEVAGPDGHGRSEMGSGGVRSDVTAVHNFVPGETRTLRFLIQGSDGRPVAKMPGWRCVLYFLPREGMTGGPVRLARAALFTVGGEDTCRCASPYVEVQIPSAQTTEVAAGDYFYQLWRTDRGNESRLAYGDFVLTE